MPMRIVRNDITVMPCDAIVNPTDPVFSGFGGTDAAVHRAAGAELDAACRALGGCAVGEAKRTPGYQLPCRHVFHTVGPVWINGKQREAELLADCYRACLSLAEEYGCESIAIPIISAGTFGFPKDLALQIAVREISAHLLAHDRVVYLVVYNRELFQISSRLFDSVQAFIDDHYVQTHLSENDFAANLSYSIGMPQTRPPTGKRPSAVKPRPPQQAPASAGFEKREEHASADLESLLENLDESFSQMLLRKIDERGIKDSDCYKRANVDRKLFSKIRNDVHYKPRKTTAIAFAIALELSMSETQDLLRKAGYTLSRSNKFDVIVEYFIRHRNYDIFEINETLYAFDQVLLG